jgi:hypothetical protein
MTSTDDEQKPLTARERLRLTGTELERTLLGAAALDGPPKGARDRLSEALAQNEMRSVLQLVAPARDVRPRWSWLTLGGLAAAAAAAVIVGSRHGPRDGARAADPGARLAADPLVAAKREPAPLVDPALANCPNPIVATGSGPLIDDFEDGNARILLNEGRSGAWMVYNDGTGMETPAHASAWHPVPIPGGRGTSRHALHTWGGVFKNWGITGGFGLATPSCYDASVYDGVRFWAKGPGRILFTAKMTQVVAVEDGGTCREKCYDVHRKSIDLTKRWTEYTVKWNELAQQGQGQPVPFDPRSLHALGFFVYGEDTPFDFWIDDLSFVPKP